MRKSVQSIVAASALIGALAVAPGLLAQDQPGAGGSGSGQPQGGMMNMMNMMNQMMEGCTKMMQSMSDRRRSGGQGDQPQPPASPERRG